MTNLRTVLCFGDSNTHGSTPYDRSEGMNRFSYEERWTTHLANGLGDGWQVLNEGLGGRTTTLDDPIEGWYKNGIKVLPAILETHKPIDLIVLMLGTNDLKMRFSLPASDIALGNERLIRTIRMTDCSSAPDGPKILLVAPPPVKEVGRLKSMFAGGAQKSAQFAQCYAEIAARNNVSFLDAGQHIKVSDEDGIHYSAQTHKVLGEAITQAVLAIV